MTDIDSLIATRSALIGQVVGLSGWITIDQEKIDRFAAVTQDEQFIHVNPDRALAETPFGGTIAHGFLTLSMGSRFAIDALPRLPGLKMSINYGFDKVRFLNPVCRGDQIRGQFVLEKVSRRAKGQMLQAYTLTTEIKGKDTPALVAQWLSLALF